MKEQKIYMRAWTEIHGRAKVMATDEWYLNLANELLPLVANSYMYQGREMVEDQRRVALSCALYLEDCVADAGHWREFIHWHKENYGCYLPFYPLSEDYLPDEINREDIAFLLWAINSPVGDDFDWVENPMDKDLLEFADVLYERLDAVFESAPISEYLAPGWMMETELMQKKREPLPVALPGEKMPTNVERFFEASNGESLMFFGSYNALKFFFVNSLKWEDEEDALLPDLAEFDNFVVYGNPKGLLIGPDVAQFFADKNNPFYSVEEAEEEAYEMFCEEGLCPFDLLKYGMEHNLLPDAQFPFENGKALLQENWDFVARWFLGEFYEGE
ncbi:MULTISPECIES: DUF3843 family protein [Bacteroides]|uniref:DUF3843 family protein n=1 Tax=Bacteroides TaxID=816 RepID=UPI0023F8E38C|nr:DUF3843 family protein [Bacteroides congonensis]